MKIWQQGKLKNTRRLTIFWRQQYFHMKAMILASEINFINCRKEPWQNLGNTTDWAMKPRVNVGSDAHLLWTNLFWPADLDSKRAESNKIELQFYQLQKWSLKKMWYLVIISSFFFFFNIPTGSHQIVCLPLFTQLYPQSPSQRHFSLALQPVEGSHLVTHIRSGCRLVRRHFDSPNKGYRWISIGK